MVYLSGWGGKDKQDRRQIRVAKQKQGLRGAMVVVVIDRRVAHPSH